MSKSALQLAKELRHRPLSYCDSTICLVDGKVEETWMGLNDDATSHEFITQRVNCRRLLQLLKSGCYA
jgi:hypothetical protein